MAVGDVASAAGYLLVPDNGPDGQVRDGAKEINRTRDYIAQVAKSVTDSKSAGREAAGISSGTGEPQGGNDGDIYFRIIA